ncbi:hypothetical protein K439DRAFT_1617791 [Ramaria rubella]|nr:hypothetical protein K439DRAFT_1617791 [Ramaria rubella]
MTAYDVDFNLVPHMDGLQTLIVTEGTKKKHFLAWVQKLPDREPPSWLSLPPTAERVIAVSQGKVEHYLRNMLLGRLRKMQTLTDDEEHEASVTTMSRDGSCYSIVKNGLLGYPRVVPDIIIAKASKALQMELGDNRDPLLQSFTYEGTVGHKLLVQVWKDLNNVMKVCKGMLKQTNHLSALMNHLTKCKVYLNKNWRDVLFTVNLPFEEASSNMVSMRALCLNDGG